jgi:hypothetical protein
LRVPVAVQQYKLDGAQPARLLALATGTDRVLYLDEVPMHFYLTHGAMKLGAVFFPAFVSPTRAVLRVPTRRSDSPRTFQPVASAELSDASWLEPDRLRFSVGWSPIQALSEEDCREGVVDLSRFGGVIWESRTTVLLAETSILVSNSGQDSVVRVASLLNEGTSETDSWRREVPAGWNGWLPLGAATAGEARRFRVDVEGNLRLKGMRVGGAALTWPWDQRACLTFLGADGRRDAAACFDPNALLPVTDAPVSVEILEDAGSTVLARLTWRTQGQNTVAQRPEAVQVR